MMLLAAPQRMEKTVKRMSASMNIVLPPKTSLNLAKMIRNPIRVPLVAGSFHLLTYFAKFFEKEGAGQCIFVPLFLSYKEGQETILINKGE